MTSMLRPSVRSLLPILFIALGLVPAALGAQEPEPAPAAETPAAAETTQPLHYSELAARFFEQIAAGEIEPAFEGLYVGNRWVTDLGSTLTDAATQMAGLHEALGDYLGHELLVEERLSERTVYLWYLAYYDRQPMSFQFLFYKPRESWRTQHFQYTQEIGALAQQLARDRLLERTVTETPEP